MYTRREFLERVGLLTGAAGVLGACSESIQRALALEPAAGSTYLDAEHVVILMQENRSFDHAFGTLQGVRGFNDPRAITLADGNPVWVQANAAGERYVPFRLDIKNTKSTWTGDLPHNRTDQVDARNHGRYDRWLQAKRSEHREYAGMPLTLGYYTRADIPFYYALADAFTICDQHFCSCLSPTTPNRLYLWSGTVRERQAADSPANLRNENVDYGRWASWTTFPERLEDHGISWKVYQNELTLESGFSEREDAWLANFGDNPLEWFTQYQVRFADTHRKYRDKMVRELPGEIAALKKQLAAHAGTAEQKAELQKRIADLSAAFTRLKAECSGWTQDRFDKLSPRDKALHTRAFCTNVGDPFYRQLVEIAYHDGAVERRLQVPKGDVLHRFRKDVTEGQLPTVSWLVSPQEFSDHPSSAWYGAWYISEVLDILTHNPDVWKKTVFILTYDENDGYFDHVPPFVAPHPRRPETGRVTKGIDVGVEYVELAQDQKRAPAGHARESSIGLGYRVPMIIASPWSRGGCVCSQVFDHTSVLQFLETFLTHKAGTKVEESNISRWRRTVCGDLTSAFQPSNRDKVRVLESLPREAFIEEIHRAQFKDLPTGYRVLTNEEIEQIRRDPGASTLLPRQEAGVRRSCPLPYELAVDGSLNDERTYFTIRFEARKEMFGERSAGSPFTVYARVASGDMKIRNYAVAAGERLEDSWALADFQSGIYHLRVYGANGFFREFVGSQEDPSVDVNFDYARNRGAGVALSGRIEIVAVNRDRRKTCTIEAQDNSYNNPTQSHRLAPGDHVTLTIDTQTSSGWYDVSARTAADERFQKRYAGRVETTEWTTSDPAMGRGIGRARLGWHS
jgi:phospholipase C